MNLFLLLTAMLSALAGIGRPIPCMPAAVEAAQVVAVAQVVAPAMTRAQAHRPDGYIAPHPLTLDLTIASSFTLAITPERRRE